MNLTDDHTSLDPLTALSPLDGRYRHKVQAVAAYSSEFALIYYRVHVAVEYFLALHEQGLPEVPPLAEATQQSVRAIYEQFDRTAAQWVKQREREINHDVKAVEYYVRERLAELEAIPAARREFVHFGLTSQDLNNTAIPMMLRDALQQAYKPALQAVMAALQEKRQAWQDIPMLARTHGQPASPTKLGKEIAVFEARLARQREHLQQLPLPAKFGGATGNLNAHYAAYPSHDWDAFARAFVEQRLGPGLRRATPTTQIEHYDDLAAVFDALRRINGVLLDLCRDCWQYISMNYFVQQVAEQEVGSSAMPHKVNPIDFENAEGNLGLANALLSHLSEKLPISRLQRDLSDSTVLRNVGMPLGYTVLALKSLQKGLGRIQANPEAIEGELDQHWAVLAEAIQTILRREGYENPYETLKALTRTGQPIDQPRLQAFVDSLELPERVKAELRALSPRTYTGNA